MYINWVKYARIARDLKLDHINRIFDQDGEDETLMFIAKWADRAYNNVCSAPQDILTVISLIEDVCPERINQEALDRCGVTSEDFEEYKDAYELVMEKNHEMYMAGLAEEIEDQRKEQAFINRYFCDIGEKEFWE